MTPVLKVGCCGWGRLMPKQRFGEDWKRKFRSVLSVYASLFQVVEINSTFYRIPKVSTAKRWYEEAKENNPNFEFTVKANQMITHKWMFEDEAFEVFERMKKICSVLKAKLLLFQTPASFGPNAANLKKLRDFFRGIERDDVVVAWEPRGGWWKRPMLIKSTCEELELINCVDPLRNTPQYLGRSSMAYFRLHGFGKPTIYQYVFSDEELEEIKRKVLSIKCKECYVLFNNMAMYDDALRFSKKVSEGY